MDTSRSDAQSEKVTEGKKWFRVTKSSNLYKVVATIISEDTNVKIKPDAKAALPKPPEQKFWEPQLYKLVGGTRYKFIVEYNNSKYCELKLKSKNGKSFQLVSVKLNVKYPSEFSGDGGAGFDGGGGMARHRGIADGKFKTLAAFSVPRGNPMAKRKPKKKAKTLTQKKDADGNTIYSSVGVADLRTREYDPTASRVYVDTSKDTSYLTAQQMKQLADNFKVLVGTIGVDDLIPADRILDVTDGVLVLSKRQTARVMEFSRLDKDALVEYKQLIEILNRTYKEEESGTFHMTVKELQDMFNMSDEDYSGFLDSSEVVGILNKVHMVTDLAEVGKYMNAMDKDGDGQMDFEEFMTLCQKMYADRGGIVVANRSGNAAFNQTRGIIDKLREKVERNHLMITHLKAQITNFDEQLEIMDTIAAHSALQQELNKCREERQQLKKLMDQMTLQNRAWMRDIKNIHAREKREVLEHIGFIEQQKNEMTEAFNFLQEAYENDYGKAMVEVQETMDALDAVRSFAEKSTQNVNVDAQQSVDMMRISKERLKQYKIAEPHSVFSPEFYNSADAIVDFMQSKTSALEEWLIARTQFTQSDREKYLKRVEEVKKKREEYEQNKKHLNKQFSTIEKTISELEKKQVVLKTANTELRGKLDDPMQREHDEAEAKELQDELQNMQEEIAQGHRDKLEWSKKLYPKEHQLHMERHKISLLQVELGELKVLLEDVHHHEYVESRATIFS